MYHAEFSFNSLGTFEFEEVKDIPEDERHYSIYFDYENLNDEPETVGKLAGFEQGDILLEVNGIEVINSFAVLRETIKVFVVMKAKLKYNVVKKH